MPLQDPERAAALVPRIASDYHLSGIEIGSNINGVMLGDPSFDPFYAAVEEAGIAIFVHALHPVASKPIAATPAFTSFALFPVEVGMAAAALIVAGTLDRFPRLRIGFSHGGGALGSILGRLDTGWEATGGYGSPDARKPSDLARTMFFDSNVYDPAYLRHITQTLSPGRIFVGTDYPYVIMQKDPGAFVQAAGLDQALASAIRREAAELFLGERLP
ncbi:MAG: amidohydrolase [Rhizorhabdus sp.]|nr:amidohydrolase [Rhizorhabdus sp.]